MDNPFLKDFDTLLSAIFTDWKNTFPQADTSRGSLLAMKSACLASALWGVYKYQDWIMLQIFPDTADSAQMEHHANIRGLTRRTDETDAELLDRLLAVIRHPPAGGNQYDYVAWAKEVDGVSSAICIPEGQGPGTVDVVVLASGDSEIPDQDLLDAVYDYIETVRPVAVTLRVLAPTIITQAVTMEVSGGDADTTAIGAAVAAYINNLAPGDDLSLAQLTALAINLGATDVSISTPSANVTCSATEMLRAGTITVTEAT